MYLSDKIISAGEITTAGEFTTNNGAFYLFLAPKTDEMKVCILSASLSWQLAESSVPFVPNEWNPVVVKSVDITTEVLAKYNVFWGIEHD